MKIYYKLPMLLSATALATGLLLGLFALQGTSELWRQGAVEDAAVVALAWRFALLALLAVLAAAGVGTIAARGIVRPLAALREAVSTGAAGPMPIGLEQNRRRDEIGELARAIARLDDGAAARAEAERASQQLRVALDNMLSGIILYDDDFKVIVANRHVHELFDYPTELMQPGRSIVDIFRYLAERGDYGPGDVEALVRARTEAYASRRVHGSEARIPDGRILEIRMSLVPGGGTVVTFDDVTERRRAEQALKASEANLKAFLDNSPASMTLKDRDGRYLLVNKVMEQRWQRPNADFIGKTTADGLLPDEAVRQVEAQERKVIESKRAVTVETALTLPDGRTLSFMMTKFPIFDDAGEVAAMGLISTDVTELKQTEAALRESERRLQTVLDNMDQGVVLFDADLKAVLFNEQALRHWDATDDTLKVGTGFLDLAHRLAEQGKLGWDVVEWMTQPEALTAVAEKPFAAEYRLLDGRFLDFRRDPVPGGGFVITQSDVTERRRAADALRASERRLQSVLEHMDQGVILYDKDLKVEVANERANELWGVSPGYFAPGGSFVDFIRFFGERGELTQAEVARVTSEPVLSTLARKPHSTEMQLTDGRVLELRRNPVPDGGFVATQTDITKRKAMENALRENQRQLTAILDSSPFAVSIIDTDRRRLYGNPRMTEMLSLDPDEVVGGQAIEVMHPEDLARLDALYRRDGVVRDFDAEARLPNGDTVWITRSVAPIEFGAVPARITWAYDITARKWAEAALRESQQQLTQILDASPFAVSIIDADGRRLYANPRMAELMGMPYEEMIGGQSIEIVSEADLERIEAIYARDGVVRDYDVEAVNLKGERFWATQTMAPIEFADTPARIIWAYDITARKQAEEALRESEAALAEKTAMLETVFRSMREGIVAFDGELKLVAWNQAYLTIRDYPAELMTEGRPFADLVRYDVERNEFGEGDPDETAKRIVERARSVESHEFERQRPDGSWIQVRGAPMPGGGFVSTVADISQRRRAEEEMRRAFSIIRESVGYASRIQRSLLPTPAQLKARVGAHFTVWEPRDVVGGDFYWVRPCQGGTLVAVADCTGHGVPGAFMTILATGALERALGRHPDGDPAALIGEMNRVIKRTLSRDDTHFLADDGIELAVCRIEEGRRLTFAGARFPLWLAEAGRVKELKGGPVGIGYRRTPADSAPACVTLELAPDSVVYFASDGLIDQIGEARKRAFGRRRFRALLESVQPLPLERQRHAILEALAAWQGGQRRRDDVTILALRPA